MTPPRILTDDESAALSTFYNRKRGEFREMTADDVRLTVPGIKLGALCRMGYLQYTMAKSCRVYSATEKGKALIGGRRENRI